MKSKSFNTLKTGDALIIVDVQNDFLPGGSLAVSHGDEVVPALNRYIRQFRDLSLPVFATRDWHPPDHCSFIEQGGPWPVHCVANATGSAFAADLELPEDAIIISKASCRDQDAYSGFEGTDLGTRLRSLVIKRLFIGGLTTDYCVLNTVKDALGLGYEVYLLEDVIRAVNVHPDDGRKAKDMMLKLGAQPITGEHIIQ